MKYILLLMFTVLFGLGASPQAQAGTLSAERGAQFGLNQASPNMMQKHQLGTKVQSQSIRIAKAKYDFAVQGGAQTTFDLVGEDGKPVVLPNKALIVDCVIDVLTTGAAGGTGLLALSTGQGAGDLKAALAAASYTGRVACIPVGSAATMIKLTADRTMTGTISTGNFTQGKLWVYVWYILGGE